MRIPGVILSLAVGSVLGARLASAAAPGSYEPVLRQSDVVFMYQGSRETYETYGATVLAWGGTPTAQAREAARGVRWFGSVGMVTEFAAYHRRFRDRYEEGLCRDVEGKPVKVPWLTDHQSAGVPYWWCCTQQPVFRQFLRDRVVETLRAGADGLHIDDHLGTSGGLWLGLCFCDRCNEGFRAHLARLSAERRERLGVKEPATFDFRATAREWLAQDGSRKVTSHPLWSEWTVYQCRAAAAFMLELRELAASTAGHPVPVGANAGLLWPRHLADYQALDLFTAETDHHAADRRFSDLPLVAYRLAEAMGRPYAATASGGDWAFVKEQNLPGLVRGWIALSYAAGQRLMAPHHQWCYTPEKGTHWYDGPAERFAPLYRFVRTKAEFLDGFRTHADLAVVIPHAAYVRNPQPWFKECNRLAAANLSYRILLAGDAIVDHPLTDTELAGPPAFLVRESDALLPDDRRRLEHAAANRPTFASAEEAVAGIRPAVSVATNAPVRLLARVKPGVAVIHVLNTGYDPARDEFIPSADLVLTIDRARLGVPAGPTARWIEPDVAPLDLAVDDDKVQVPRLSVWGLLVLGFR